MSRHAAYETPLELHSQVRPEQFSSEGIQFRGHGTWMTSTGSRSFSAVLACISKLA